MVDERTEFEDSPEKTVPVEEAVESQGGEIAPGVPAAEATACSGGTIAVDEAEEKATQAAAPTASAGSNGSGVKPSREEGGSQVDYSDTFRSLSIGDVVSGVVVHIDKEGVLVDVGTKSEGIIRPGELASRPVQSPEDVVSVGDTIDVYVVHPENEDGNLVLSKKRADFEKAWERLQQAFEEGKTLTAMVTDRVKGGLVVDLGIRGFVPGSHVGSGSIKNLDRYVGQSLPLKVIEVDRERRKVVLSHRLAVDEERTKQRSETVSTLVEGEIREGIVRRITDYGAFVDLGGIDGLLHVSEMSWTRISHPSEVVKVGQKVNVMILKLNLDAGRVSLGLRQILPDPWSSVEEKYRVGDIINAPISRLVPFGAFVQLEEGIEAIIPNSELALRRVKRPEDVVQVGEQVQVQVIDLRPEERRMTLSIRAIQEETERKEYDSYQSSRQITTRMTLGDLVGEKLQELAAFQNEADVAEKAAEPAEEVQAVEEPEPPQAAKAEAVVLADKPAEEAVAVEPADESPVEPTAAAADEPTEEAPAETAEAAGAEEETS